MYNYLPENTHKLVIPGLDDLTFYVTNLELPTVSVDELSYNTGPSIVKVPGNTISYTPLSIRFVVSEDMQNYELLFNWITSQKSGEPNLTQYQNLVTDAALSIMTANSTSNRVITFQGLFPTEVGGLSFNTTSSDIVYVTGEASFSFTSFKFSS